MANMGLTTINASDYVSVDTLNENFGKLDALGACYVVESGTTGEWWWRKWSDGTAECGIVRHQFAAAHVSKDAASGLYWTGNLSLGSFPVAFKSVPAVTFTSPTDAANGNRWLIMGTRGTTSNTTCPAFCVGGWASGDVTCVIGVHAIGRWAD